MPLIKSISRERVYFTGTISLFVSILLASEQINGGVVTHHLMASADMPGISNWWGLVALPLLAWVLFPSDQADDFNRGLFGFSALTMIRFVGAIVYGAAMALSYEFGFEQATTGLLFILFPTGILVKLYRGELIVGLVIGMAYTFGALIPMGVAVIVALASLLLNTAARFVFHKLKK